MRTTVTLDADVVGLLRNVMRRRGLSFKEALNQAIRTALSAGHRKKTQRYRLRTYKMGFKPEANLDKALALAGTLEDEEIARKLSLRK